MAPTMEGNPVGQSQIQLCMVCGKRSDKTICEACSERIRGEALNKKKKEEKPKG